MFKLFAQIEPLAYVGIAVNFLLIALFPPIVFAILALGIYVFVQLSGIVTQHVFEEAAKGVAIIFAAYILAALFPPLGIVSGMLCFGAAAILPRLPADLGPRNVVPLTKLPLKR